MNRESNSATDRDNPLLPLVLRLLRERPEGLSEYDLLKRIETESTHFDDSGADDAQLALFRKHFLIMNALYRLQETLWRDEGLRLTISPLRIALEAARINADDTPAASGAVVSHGDAALRAYYLDWQQFIATDGAAVAELLAGFWRRYAAHDGRAEALAVLQLGVDADWQTVRRQYRRLAAASHPDRGGDTARFLAVRAAYEALSLAMR